MLEINKNGLAVLNHGDGIRVPDYCNIAGNETAVELAKIGGIGIGPESIYRCTTLTKKTLINTLREDKFESYWPNLPTCRQEKNYTTRNKKTSECQY